MRRLLSFLWLVILGPLAAIAASSLEHAREAAALLGEDTWSRILRIENTGGRERFPKTVYAVAFEFGGLLWFYTDGAGTQSLSLHEDNLAAEQADLAPLLRGIDPGFTVFEVVERIGRVRPPRPGELPNGCFLDSIAGLRRRVARGDLILRARLISFYGPSHAGRYGHTVLAYETPAGAFVLDAQNTVRPRRIGERLPGDPREAIAAIEPRAPVEIARWVPTTVPPSGRVAATERDAAAAGFRRGVLAR